MASRWQQLLRRAEGGAEGGGRKRRRRRGGALARVRCPSLRRQPNQTLVTSLSLSRCNLVNLVPSGFGSSIRCVLLSHTLRQVWKVVPVRIPDQLRPPGNSHYSSLCGRNFAEVGPVVVRVRRCSATVRETQNSWEETGPSWWRSSARTPG